MPRCFDYESHLVTCADIHRICLATSGCKPGKTMAAIPMFANSASTKKKKKHSWEKLILQLKYIFTYTVQYFENKEYSELVGVYISYRML